MNAKTLLAAVSLAVAGSAAMASEATQFADPVSTLSRAEVKADLPAAIKHGAVVGYGEATVFADAPATAHRSREEVRGEARAAARDLSFNELYAG